MRGDSFILNRDVVAGLESQEALNGAPGSRKAMAAIRAAIDRWTADSGHSFNEIRRVPARSIG